MPNVCIRFIADQGFVGRSIRWVTNSLYQHVEFGTPEGTWIGAHAGGGIMERPADYCKPRLEHVYDIPCTQSQQAELIGWARSKIGTKYNYLDILGLMFRYRSWTTPGRLICSQFVTEGMLRVFGASRFLNVLSDEVYTALVTPEMAHLSPIFVGHRRKSPCP